MLEGKQANIAAKWELNSLDILDPVITMKPPKVPQSGGVSPRVKRNKHRETVEITKTSQSPSKPSLPRNSFNKQYTKFIEEAY